VKSSGNSSNTAAVSVTKELITTACRADHTPAMKSLCAVLSDVKAAQWGMWCFFAQQSFCHAGCCGGSTLAPAPCAQQRLTAPGTASPTCLALRRQRSHLKSQHAKLIRAQLLCCCLLCAFCLLAQVQAAIGAKNAVAFDLTAACSGFVLALVTAAQFVRTGTAKHVLVVGADAMSRVVDWRDRGEQQPCVPRVRLGHPLAMAQM
jgi:hypothetical protein